MADKLADSIKKLEEIEKFFDQESFDLEEGLQKYEEGKKLLKKVSDSLKSYELKIEEIDKKYEI